MDDGLWINEVKATCYANQFAYLDSRPVTEQKALNKQVELCEKYCDLRVHNAEVKKEEGSMSTWSAVLWIGAGVLVGFVLGAGYGVAR